MVVVTELFPAELGTPTITEAAGHRPPIDEYVRDPFIDQLADELGLSTHATTAAIRHFVDGVPHDAVGMELGLPEDTAQKLAYHGLHKIKKGVDAARMAQYQPEVLPSGAIAIPLYDVLAGDHRVGVLRLILEPVQTPPDQI